MKRIRAFVQTLLAACCALVAAACGGGNGTPPAATIPFSAAAARPDTLHVVPLLQLRSAQSIIGLGSSGGLIGTPATGLYGVAAFGGDRKCATSPSNEGCGFVYELVQNSTGRWQLKILHTFDGVHGAEPTAALFRTVRNVLVGTTAYGGTYGKGTVFELYPSGTHFKVLHSFGKNGDGAYPYAGVMEHKDVLYGTASAGGTHTACGHGVGCGIVYGVSEQPPYAETVLHNFPSAPSDGTVPYARLNHVDGVLYGTTSQGGRHGCGTIFSITASGAERVLHGFRNSPKDGCAPFASVVELKGTLYGTTSAGGETSCQCGTVYSVSLDGVEKPLHDFSGGDGAAPDASLIAVHDSLYGTTVYGGGKCRLWQGGCGVIFSVTPSTSGTSTFASLFRFVGDDRGAEPASPLHWRDGVIYGTTSAAGRFDHGAVIKFTPPSTVTTR